MIRASILAALALLASSLAGAQALTHAQRPA